MTNPDHIKAALEIENKVKPEERDTYLVFLNGKPMSERVTPQEQRDGCILSQLFSSTLKNT